MKTPGFARCALAALALGSGGCATIFAKRVDPNSGALFTLKPKQVDATLSSLKASRDVSARNLTVMLLEMALGNSRIN